MWFSRNSDGCRSNQFHTLIKMLVTTEIIFCVVKQNRVPYLKMKKRIQLVFAYNANQDDGL